MSLKQKTISGLSWSFIDTFAKYGLTFFISIILARALTPSDFGLIGMTNIFISISKTFVDSGFSQALIRKQDSTNNELSSVFYFNLILAGIFFLIIFLNAGFISIFLNEPKLKLLIQVISFDILIGAFGSIHQTILNKTINFKLQTNISIISTIIAGIVSVTMALNNYGVRSLVASLIISQFVTTLLLWHWNKWLPTRIFKFHYIKELFGFGSKLLYSSLINTLFNNIYYIVIGKYFSASELGYYTRADNFQKLISENITQNLQRVSYPVLASIQNDKTQLKSAYKKMIKTTMIFNFVFLFVMIGVSKSLIVSLIGLKWLPAVSYLQILCFIGMFYPLNAINLNMLNVLGRSDLFLKLEIIKKGLMIPIIVIGIFYGIKVMVIGMLCNTIIAYYFNSYWSGKFIGYSIKEQIKDIIPGFILGVLTCIFVYFLGEILYLETRIILSIQLIGSILFILFICEITKLSDYIFIKRMIIEQFNRKVNI